MSQILASPIMSFFIVLIAICMILLTVGFLYCLWHGRFDIEFLKLRIIGKGDKK
jgi:hypothetical protein